MRGVIERVDAIEAAHRSRCRARRGALAICADLVHGTRSTAPTAMRAIVSDIHARPVAIDERHLARVRADTTRAHLRSRAHAVASTTVPRIATNIDADPTTKLRTIRTDRLALAVATSRPAWADPSALAAVQGIPGKIDASSLTLREREGTAVRDAIAHCAHTLGWTLNIAGTAIRGIVHGIDTALIAAQPIPWTYLDDPRVPRIVRCVA